MVCSVYYSGVSQAAVGCVCFNGKEMLTKLTWSHSGIISCVDLLKITVKYQSVIFPCFRYQCVHHPHVAHPNDEIRNQEVKDSRIMKFQVTRNLTKGQDKYIKFQPHLNIPWNSYDFPAFPAIVATLRVFEVCEECQHPHRNGEFCDLSTKRQTKTHTHGKTDNKFHKLVLAAS